MTKQDDCSPTTPTPGTTTTPKEHCAVQLTGYVECCCPPPPVVRKQCLRHRRFGNCDDTSLDQNIASFLSQFAGASILDFNLVDLGHQGWLLSVRLYCDEIPAGK